MVPKIEFEDLLNSEKYFFNLCMPSHVHPSQDVIGSNCCRQNCVYYMRRFDVLTARHHYVQFYNQLDDLGKRESRYLFISTLVRIDDFCYKFVPVNLDVPICPDLISRIFGFSTHVLMNAVNDSCLKRYTSRPWYQKTVESLSSALFALSKSVQFNSLSQLMLPPKFSSRSPHPDTIAIPIPMFRDKLDIDVRERKSDTLTRCIACCAIPDLRENARSVLERKEAEKHLKMHHIAISQQRVVVQCLTMQSRDPDSDVSVCLFDAMSNKCTKLPHLVSRPKNITDSDRIPLNLSTVQLAESFGTCKFRNIEFPMLQTFFNHDSNYNCSILLNGISKFKSISSTIFVVMDSSRNNKSFVFLGTIGYVLTKLRHVRKIVLLYPSVGHTHMSVDAHFGAVSKSMMARDIKDPIEFANFLSELPSVGSVEEAPTVYDFALVTDYMNKPSGLCSNGVISLVRNSEGIIHYASSLTLNAAQLVGAETNETCRKLFKDSFYTSAFSPTIQEPNRNELTDRVRKMLDDSPSVFSDLNKNHFETFMANYGSVSFRQLISEINSIPQKLPDLYLSNTEDMQMTVLAYLEKNGINAGRIPKTPVVGVNQLMN